MLLYKVLPYLILLSSFVFFLIFFSLKGQQGMVLSVFLSEAHDSFEPHQKATGLPFFFRCLLSWFCSSHSIPRDIKDVVICVASHHAENNNYYYLLFVICYLLFIIITLLSAFHPSLYQSLFCVFFHVR
jgi:hypothetical protein